MPKAKKCKTCNRTKPYRLYYKRKANKDGYSTSCKSCINKTTNHAAHDTAIRRKYGITHQEYEKQLSKQGGRCYICRGGTSHYYFAVDHNHKTGEPRGLLCMNCNNVLGKFRDDPQRFRRATDYLEHPPFRQVLGERDWSDYQDDKSKPKRRSNRRRSH